MHLYFTSVLEKYTANQTTYWRTGISQDADISKQDFKVFRAVRVWTHFPRHPFGLTAVLETHCLGSLGLLRELLLQIVNVVESLHLIPLRTGRSGTGGWFYGGGDWRVTFILRTFITSLEECHEKFLVSGRIFQ